jgi:hypothetical protein
MSTKEVLGKKLQEMWYEVEGNMTHEEMIDDIRRELDQMFEGLREVHDALVMATLIDKSNVCRNAVYKLDTILLPTIH